MTSDFFQKAAIGNLGNQNATSQNTFKAKFIEEFKLRAYRHDPHAKNSNALLPGVDVITLDSTANWSYLNPVADMYSLRGLATRRLEWIEGLTHVDMPNTQRPAESDLCDTPATVYFLKRFLDGSPACTVRFHPSTDVYNTDISMIGRNLPFLIEEGHKLPENFFETSRVVMDEIRLPSRLEDDSPNPDRRKAFHDTLAASVLYANMRGIAGFFCFMPVKVWERAYKAMGLEVDRLGPNTTMEDSRQYEVYAGQMAFTPEIMQRVRETTSFHENLLNFGIHPMEAFKLQQQIAAELDNNPVEEPKIHMEQG